jgi:hypothetical protein
MHELLRQHGTMADVQGQAAQRVGSPTRCTGGYWTPATLQPERRLEKDVAQSREPETGKVGMLSEREEAILVFSTHCAANVEKAPASTS